MRAMVIHEGTHDGAPMMFVWELNGSHVDAEFSWPGFGTPRYDIRVNGVGRMHMVAPHDFAEWMSERAAASRQPAFENQTRLELET